MSDGMSRGTTDAKVLRVAAYVASAINLLLALNYFPLVPCLSWLTFGNVASAARQLPDALLLIVLPAGYYVYWHYWFVTTVPAAILSLLLFRRTGDQRARYLALLNAGMIVLYFAVRMALGLLGIHPDIV
jgi:hypothetical protein